MGFTYPDKFTHLNTFVIHVFYKHNEIETQESLQYIVHLVQ